MLNNTYFYAFIMLLAGLGIPVMAALNGGLGVKLQSPVLAAVILLSGGLLFALTILLLGEGMPATLNTSETPWYFYCGGIFVIFYVLSITWVAPRFGVANAVSFVLLGQLAAMTLIDHFGALGAIQYTVTPQRIAGLVLMTMGVLLVVNRH